MQAELGVEFSAVCNGNSCLSLRRRASSSEPFLTSVIGGEALWVHPPDGSVAAYQQRYAKAKADTPVNTCAVFCVPQSSEHEELFKAAGYQLVKESPIGKHLFTVPCRSGPTCAAQLADGITCPWHL